MFSKSRMKLSSCRAFWRTELNRESARHSSECVWESVCVCTTDTATQILLLLLLPLSYIAPPSQLFQEELDWRNTSRKRNSSLRTHDQMNSFMHHSMCLCFIYSTNPLPILGLERFPTGVVASDWCSPPGYLWRSFPKTALSKFSHVPPTVDYRRKWYKSVCRIHQSKRSAAVAAIRKSSHSVRQFQEDLQGITWDRLKRIISYDRFCSGKQTAKKNLWFLGSQNVSLGWASPSKWVREVD